MHKVFLPKTEFNVYNKNYDNIREYWEQTKLEELRFLKRKDAKNFILHDGPPYANGPIHMGHAENKFWKDVLNKFFWQAGFNTPYIPGWDSHGLPIETAVEKKLKEDGVDRKTLTRQEFWDKCYEFSAHWMKEQMKGFKRLGIFADYENSYATFFEPESIGIIECIHHFVEKGLVEQKLKPVLWSPAEKTALAYAEVEYKDKVSNSIYIKFPVLKTFIKELEHGNILVWTTTPWTLPANETLAYNEHFTYVIFKKDDEIFCIQENLLEDLKKIFESSSSNSSQSFEVIRTIKADQLHNTVVSHPLKEFAKEKLLIHSDHVTKEKGTGFVHIAPAHGEDDFEIGRKYNLEIVDLLDENGNFKQEVPLVGSNSIKEAEKIVIKALEEQKALIHLEQFTHSYPHSWRSKAPLIFRLTEQWFLNMKPIKETALKALEDDLHWVPAEGENRFRAMLQTREDWCISRQRVWGIPLSIFYEKETGKVITDSEFLKATRNLLALRGVKNWWNIKISDIDSKYSDEDYARCDDIVDIWFESGSTQYFILQKKGLFPSDVYLEGSDQHRGWFQSSLLISAFQTGKAPWKNLITHGFCLDKERQKMSKSLGNVVDPASWNEDHLRVFFASMNLCFDISITEESILHSQEILFRFRNTIKFLIGILNTPNTCEIEYDQLPDLEKWVLHRLSELDQEYGKVLKTFEVSPFLNELYEFCAQDLSAFYFDIRKDTLYCDKKNNQTRGSVLFVMRILLETLLKWLAPITSYSSEEAWQCYLKDQNLPATSIHLEERPKLNSEYENHTANEKIKYLRNLRRKITTEIEKLRETKKIATSHEVDVEFYTHDFHENLDAQLLKEISLVSKLEIRKGDEKIIVKKNLGKKCRRCKFFFQEIHDETCNRCMEAEKDF